MSCGKVVPAITVNIALCGSIPRSRLFQRAAGTSDSDVIKSDFYPAHNPKTPISVQSVSSLGNGLVISDQTFQRSGKENIHCTSSACKISANPFSGISNCSNISNASEPVEALAAVKNITKSDTKTFCLTQKKINASIVSKATANSNIGTSSANQAFAPPSISNQNLTKNSNLGENNVSHENKISQTKPEPKDIEMMKSGDFDIPSWAVAANGESRLEPVCEANDTHSSIDLTDRPVHNIGRSPSNHVLLYHRTSSRRHALIYHHPCGACYLIDCHSAHGTYVSGNRIPPLVPVRIKRGSLIRFGGPGAPAFILKSFSTNLDRMVHDLGGLANAFGNNSLSREMQFLQQQTNANGVACIRGDGGMACLVDGNDAPNAALVLLNTRLNAYGGLKYLTPSCCKLARRAKVHFSAQCESTSGEKRLRSMDDTPECSPKKRRVGSILMSSNLSHKMNFAANPTTSDEDVGYIKKKRVMFTDEQPVAFYPPSVTPDELSSDEECGEEEVNMRLALQPIAAA